MEHQGFGYSGRGGAIMPKQARLRIYGHGGVEVELAADYLTDLKRAHDSILFFEASIDGMRRIARDFPFPLYPFGPDFRRLSGSRRTGLGGQSWPPTAQEIALFVPRAEQLILAAVSIHSPGYWDLIGALNPLEVSRKYLNDRHERRKDHEYRESAEKRRLVLENLSLENQVISERIRLAKEIGATDRDLAPLLNELVFKPLVALDRYQDKGVIENTEIPPDPDRQ
jgi:hypothetical protein